MATVNDVEKAVFEILGDFVDPKQDVMIHEVRGNIRVIVTRTYGIPKDIIRDEWRESTKDLGFENVSLYL